MPRIMIKRGTRAQLDAAATAGQLAAGEPYLVTDEGVVAIGLSASTYGDVGGDISPASTTAAGTVELATTEETQTGTDDTRAVTPAGAAGAYVPKALFNANTILAADSDNTPAALTMGASTILARLASGNIKAASVAEMLTLLSVASGATVGLSGCYVGNFTRDLSLASGTQDVTCGFTPKAVLLMATINGAAGVLSIGFADGTRNSCLLDFSYNTAGAYYVLTGSSIAVYVAAVGGNQLATTSFIADGFRVSWVKYGSPSVTANLLYMAMV